MSLGSAFKGKVLEFFGARVVREADRELSSGKYGEGPMRLWKRFVTFMNGKKTYTGALLLALPKAAAAVSAALLSAGYDPTDVAKWTMWGTGGVLAAIGMVHKIVKLLDDLTPDDKNQLRDGLVVVLLCLSAATLPGCQGTVPTAPTTEISPAPPSQSIVSLAVAARQNGSIVESVLRGTYFSIEAGPRCSIAELPCPRVSRVQWHVTGAFCEYLGDITAPTVVFRCLGAGVAQFEVTDLDSKAAGMARIEIEMPT